MRIAILVPTPAALQNTSRSPFSIADTISSTLATSNIFIANLLPTPFTLQRVLKHNCSSELRKPNNVIEASLTTVSTNRVIFSPVFAAEDNVLAEQNTLNPTPFTPRIKKSSSVDSTNPDSLPIIPEQSYFPTGGKVYSNPINFSIKHIDFKKFFVIT
jgi:hypothetical protein